MSNIPRKLRVGVVAGAAISLAASSWVLAATTTVLQVAVTPDVFVTEIQTTNTTASEEFIELYNNTGNDIDLADATHSGKDPWKLQFFGATATATGLPDWTKPSATISLTGTITAHSYFLLSSAQMVNGALTTYKPGDIDPDQTYTARLSDSGGGLQLVDVAAAVSTVHDRAVWQKPVDGQLLPDGVLTAPAAGGSLQRLPNDMGEYVQEDDSLASFAPEALVSPKDAWTVPEEITDGQDSSSPDESDMAPADGTASDVQDPGTSPGTSADRAAQLEPVISELLPNPAAPQNDTDNEFIELYNPNTTSFDLTGYTIEAGTTTLHDFTFTENASLPPLSYTAFFSSLTSIALANGGSQVRLLSSDNEVVSESSAYTTASEGQAWAWNGSSWQWTTTPTPGAGNIITLPAILTTSSTAIKSKTAAKSAAKVKGVSTTKTKKAAPKSTKKTAKKTTSGTTSDQSGAAQDTSQVTPIHPWTLAMVGMAAILYGAYEYRTDLKNYFYQRFQNRAARRAARAEA